MKRISISSESTRLIIAWQSAVKEWNKLREQEQQLSSANLYIATPNRLKLAVSNIFLRVARVWMCMGEEEKKFFLPFWENQNDDIIL